MDNDPAPNLGEAATTASERITLMVSLAAAVAQMVADQQASRRAREAEEIATRNAENKQRREWFDKQEKARLRTARTEWEPGRDAGWLADADLMTTAHAWGAALPYGQDADTWRESARTAKAHADQLELTAEDPAEYARAKAEAKRNRELADYAADAAEAMRGCERRLSELHPHAMSHYDRFRAAGDSPGEAMAKAAPFFNRRADTTPVKPESTLERGRPQRALEQSSSDDHTPTPSPEGSPVDIERWKAEVRALAIVWRIQDDRASRRQEPFDKDELRTVLRIQTNLAEDVIDHVVSDEVRRGPYAPGTVAADLARADIAERRRAADLGHADPATPDLDERTDALDDAQGQAGVAAAARARARAVTGGPADLAQLDYPVGIGDAVRAPGKETAASATIKRADPRPRRGPTP